MAKCPKWLMLGVNFTFNRLYDYLRFFLCKKRLEKTTNIQEIGRFSTVAKMAVLGHFANLKRLRGCPCKNRPLDFRPKTEFLQIFRVRQLVHVINKNGNNLAAFNAIFQYFSRQFQRTVQNRLNRSVSSQI